MFRRSWRDGQNRTADDLWPEFSDPGSVWADLGSSYGTFSRKICEMMGDEARLIAVDRDCRALETLKKEMGPRFKGIQLETRCTDFSRPLDLPPLDGFLVANALHFIPTGAQQSVFDAFVGLLKPGGRAVVIEYAANRGNRFVPHPFDADRCLEMFAAAGLLNGEIAKRRSSSFLNGMYTAVATKPV